MPLRSSAVRTAVGLATAALVMTAVGGAPISTASTTDPAGVTPAAGSGATTLVSRAGGQKATISVLPAISQPGKRVAGPGRALGVIAVRVSPATSGRPVRLERLVGSRWLKAGQARLNERGLVDFTIPGAVDDEPDTYRAVAVRHGGRPAVRTDEVLSSEWGAPDFLDEFIGRRLGEAWTDRGADYNPDGLRRCSKGSPKAVRVRGGAVRLSVLVDKSKGGRLCVARRADGSPLGRFKYRLNGHISTHFSAGIRYGVAAARMKFQRPKGQHASFWMQPEVLNGARTAEKAGAEIDIVEWFGHPSRNGGLTSFVYHPTKRGPQKVGDFIDDPQQYLADRSDAWWKRYHVFSLEWTPRAYIFRIDGHETWRTTAGISGVRQYPILSLLSSDYELPNLGGERRLPQHMYVDWVQLWQAGSPL